MFYISTTKNALKTLSKRPYIAELTSESGKVERRFIDPHKTGSSNQRLSWTAEPNPYEVYEVRTGLWDKAANRFTQTTIWLGFDGDNIAHLLTHDEAVNMVLTKALPAPEGHSEGGALVAKAAYRIIPEEILIYEEHLPLDQREPDDE